jgi:rSAM/selenodomain-associated transferase 2
MLTIVIPTLDAERVLGATLGALVAGAVAGLVKQVIVVDGGSADETVAIAQGAGCEVIRTRKSRGHQLARGGAAARAGWMLFLHADTVLEPGWDAEVRRFIETAEHCGDTDRAAAFAFRLDARGARARLLEHGVWLRCALFALPYGDQGLVISRRLYERIGGYKDVPLMEDVDLVRSIGRRRLHFLRAAAVTSAERYVKEGFVLRAARNLVFLGLYYLHVPSRLLARFYGA